MNTAPSEIQEIQAEVCWIAGWKSDHRVAFGVRIPQELRIGKVLSAEGHLVGNFQRTGSTTASLYVYGLENPESHTHLKLRYLKSLDTARKEICTMIDIPAVTLNCDRTDLLRLLSKGPMTMEEIRAFNAQHTSYPYFVALELRESGLIEWLGDYELWVITHDGDAFVRLLEASNN